MGMPKTAQVRDEFTITVTTQYELRRGDGMADATDIDRNMFYLMEDREDIDEVTVTFKDRAPLTYSR